MLTPCGPRHDTRDRCSPHLHSPPPVPPHAQDYPDKAGSHHRAVLARRRDRQQRARRRRCARRRGSASRSSSRTARARAATSARSSSRRPRPTATRCCSASTARWSSTRTCSRSCRSTRCRDFAPVTKLGDAALILVAHPSLPAKNLAEFIALREEVEAGALPYGTSGTGGTPHLAGELLKQRTGIALEHIPYKGGGQAIIDVVGGQIPLVFTAVATAQQYVKAGRLDGARRAERQARRRRCPMCRPSSRAAQPGFDVDSWVGMLAPAKTPRAGRRPAAAGDRRGAADAARCASATRRSASSRSATPRASSRSRSAPISRAGRRSSSKPTSVSSEGPIHGRSHPLSLPAATASSRGRSSIPAASPPSPASRSSACASGARCRSRKGSGRSRRTSNALGRPPTAFCACELRSPEPFTEEGFKAFNRVYVGTLERWGLFKDEVNPVARSNVCPEIDKPPAPELPRVLVHGSGGGARAGELHHRRQRRGGGRAAAATANASSATATPRPRACARRRAGCSPSRSGGWQRSASAGRRDRDAGLHGPRHPLASRRGDRRAAARCRRADLALRAAAGAGPRLRDGRARRRARDRDAAEGVNRNDYREHRRRRRRHHGQRHRAGVRRRRATR